MSWHPDLILNCHLRTNIPGEPGLDYPIHNIVQVGFTPVWIYSCGHSVTGDFIYLRWQRIWGILRWPRDGLPGLSYLSDGMRYGDLWTYFWGLNFNGDIKSMSNYFSEETNWGFESMEVSCLKSEKLIVFWGDAVGRVGGSWLLRGKERTINPPWITTLSFPSRLCNWWYKS